MIALLGFLLLEPVVKHLDYRKQKPLLVVLEDYSSSMESVLESARDLHLKLNRIEKELKQEYDIQHFTFDQEINFNMDDDDQFTGTETNISNAIKVIDQQYADQNLSGIVLVTDGIHNAGVDPILTSASLHVPVYAIGIGDTTLYSDICVDDLTCNSIAYLGNTFKLKASIKAEQITAKNSVVRVIVNGVERGRKQVFLSPENNYKELEFTLQAHTKGIQKVELKLDSFNGEKNKRNNTQICYVDVIERKRKVVIWTEQTHPDISTLKSAIASNENYEAAVEMNQFSLPKNVDLVILYDWFTSKANVKKYKQLIAAKIPTLLILGQLSKPSVFNQGSQALKFTNINATTNAATPKLNPEFDYFNWSESAQTVGQWPPLISWYGKLKGHMPSDVLLYQQIGNVVTKEPQWLMHNENGYRYSIVLGSGLWRWKLAHFDRNGSHDIFHELINKTLQYLTVNRNKQRLRVYSKAREYGRFEKVVIHGELYSQSYDKINNQEINLTVSDQRNKQYTYLMAQDNGNYRTEIQGLLPGTYQFTAQTVSGGQALKQQGTFVISNLQKERIRQRADFELLRKIGHKTGGKMLTSNEVQNLVPLLSNQPQVKTQILEDFSYTNLIRFKTIFWVLFAFLSIEWFVRKWAGGY